MKKCEAATALKEWQMVVERETGHKIGILNTDNGGKYTSKDYETYLCHEGISHHVTAPHTSAEMASLSAVTVPPCLVPGQFDLVPSYLQCSGLSVPKWPAI